MKNWEVVIAFIENALAYGEDSDLETVMTNLKYMQKLMRNPFGENEDYDWNDFK